jgi:hypothetical protein
MFIRAVSHGILNNEDSAAASLGYYLNWPFLEGSNSEFYTFEKNGKNYILWNVMQINEK